jgi:hypothetical protein
MKYFCFLCGYTFFSKVSGTWKLVNYPEPRPRNSFISSSNRFRPFRAPRSIQRLELAERLDGLASAGQDTQDVEADL